MTSSTITRSAKLHAPELSAEHIAEIEAALATTHSDWQPTGLPTGVTYTDIFCGFGGSSIGLENAGMTLVLGANHWAKAIETLGEAASWELFDIWLAAMDKMGYNHHFISVSSAHIGDDANPHAPQWRDRLYIVFTSVSLPTIDIRPRPLAWCPECDEINPAVQSWKRLDRRRIGKYRQQYVYRCPASACKHRIVEPFVRPAAVAIDWSDLGQR